MSHLFSATRIGQLALDNRIVIAPMCQYSADEGKATSWHRIHLGQLAFSGAGLLILEATAVEPAGRISPGDLGLWDDETENALRAVVEDIRAWSPIRLGIQLGHAGRKASCAAPWQGGHQLALNEGGWRNRCPLRRGVSRWRPRPRRAEPCRYGAHQSGVCRQRVARPASGL